MDLFPFRTDCEYPSCASQRYQRMTQHVFVIDFGKESLLLTVLWNPEDEVQISRKLSNQVRTQVDLPAGRELAPSSQHFLSDIAEVWKCSTLDIERY